MPEILQPRRQVRLLVVEHNSFFPDVSSFDDLTSSNGSIGNLRVRVAEDFDEAVALVRSWSPDVIMFDVYTNVAHSFELIERWRDSAYLVVTSEKHCNDLEARAFKAGAHQFLIKPLTVEEVDTFLNDLVVFLPNQNNQIIN